MTQGDPPVVRARMEAIVERFGLQPYGLDIGLHWYEWHAIKFDTKYPDYFPVRAGFEDAVAALQPLGVRIHPYINGRIWDISTPTWTQDNGTLVAVKTVKQRLDDGNLTIPHESYGSGATFAVACPSMAYWQVRPRVRASGASAEQDLQGAAAHSGRLAAS